MSTVIVIPARYESKRFPGKPLIEVAGQSLLQRTWRIAKAVTGVDDVIVATDDERIKEHVHSFGGKVIMTSPECENGTERVYEAVKHSQQDIIINLQGDAILTPYWVVQDLLNSMIADPSIAIATPATQLSWAQYDELKALKAAGSGTGTMVTTDINGNALYFSRALIPNLRQRDESALPPVYRHIGLYGYRYKALEKYLTLKPTPLEQAEKLEQLRALENSIPIKVVIVDYRGRTHGSVDSPQDVTIIEKIISQEGELLSFSEAK